MTKSEDNEGFISRWSRRKLDDEAKTEPEPSVASELPDDFDDKDLSQAEETLPSVTDEALPIWQQKDADPKLKIAALRDLFHTAEFNERDGLNDYDHDYTQQWKLGDIVTSQMKRMIKLAQQKHELGSEHSPKAENSPSLPAQAENTALPTDNNEDDKIA